MNIREATVEDLDDVLEVERLAFGHDKEAELVNELLVDQTARPLISLLAYAGDRAVGHVLFSSASLIDSQNELKISLLAPLAVVPDMQGVGIGGILIQRGLETLKESGVELVFVLGHPGYYPKHGFSPAGVLGFEAPYPIPVEHADAWMVKGLQPGVIGSASGTVTCAEALQKPEHWRE